MPACHVPTVSSHIIFRFAIMEADGRRGLPKLPRFYWYWSRFMHLRVQSASNFNGHLLDTTDPRLNKVIQLDERAHRSGRIGGAGPKGFCTMTSRRCDRMHQDEYCYEVPSICCGPS